MGKGILPRTAIDSYQLKVDFFMTDTPVIQTPTEWSNVGNIINDSYNQGKQIAYLNHVNIKLIIDSDLNVLIEGAPDGDSPHCFKIVSRVIPSKNGNTARIPIFGTNITCNMSKLNEVRAGLKPWVQIAIPKQPQYVPKSKVIDDPAVA